MPLPEERDVRLKKSELLKKNGVAVYPSISHRTHLCVELIENFNTLQTKGSEVIVAGRIRGIRRHGGSTFAVLEDGSGRIQLLLKRDKIRAEQYDVFTETIDIGDFIDAHGLLFLTKTAEKTIELSEYHVLGKALRPLPEQWHGLSDVELRYRERYLDLISHPDVRDLFRMRSEVVKAIREYHEQHGFLEVETPILQHQAGGALARPFVTHHNALGEDLYLRIAPELFLKRLTIGGYERVYEIARCFRNEGIDHIHNPEFTQVEAYMAYADYTSLMEFFEGLIRAIIHRLFARTACTIGGVEIDVSRPFARITFHALIQKNIGIDLLSDSLSDMCDALKRHRFDGELPKTLGQAADLLFKIAQKQIIQPTFVIDSPVELIPLAKRKVDQSLVVESFQCVVSGVEIAKGFSELNDPIDQLDRFLQQQKAREKGDEEAHVVDTEYVRALEYGLPPTAGYGMGIDRFVSFITNSHSLKEVILFPTLRSKE